MSGRIEVVCTCCSTRLVVDVATGDVLSEERPKVTDRTSFDEALREVRAGAGRREKAFADAFDRTRRLDDVLEKKFDEARKKAAKSGDDKPVNPLDLD